MSTDYQTITVQIPEGTVAWQVVCQGCDARYALMHADHADAPHPRHCAFCASRAIFYRLPAKGVERA